MNESTLNDALKVALNSPIEEVVTHAEVIAEQLETIDDLGGFNQGGKDLYDEIKAVSFFAPVECSWINSIFGVGENC
jgi:hypothetical protein